ncbi:coiled-coil domain-containing protein 3-like isoform X2 [Bubalus bubalis]|nr:coiled-coil domain-containing protein 3-like isoform X2 [Bubalus bubalis]
MDENYNFLPHGVNLQDAIFPDTQENRRIFSSLFQFSKCSQGQQLATFFSDWEVQEDTRLQEAQDQLTEAVRCAEKTRDHVQKLEIENVKLQTTVKKQVGKIEELRKKLLSTRSFEDEKEQLKKYIELKQSLENNLDQEKKKNSEFKKEITGLMILQQSWKLHLQNVCTWMQKIKFFERSYYL